MNNIYLIGMMGSGKTSTGKALARMLRAQFVDLDDALMRYFGKTITQIFEEDGEAAFRHVESEQLKFAAHKHHHVVATGGGVVIQPQNIQWMKTTGTVIYLKTDLKHLWKRVQNSKDRPLLKVVSAEERLNEIHHGRTSLYEQTADFTVLTDAKKPEAV